MTDSVCVACGTPLGPEDRFCLQCGATASPVDAPAAPPVDAAKPTSVLRGLARTLLGKKISATAMSVTLLPPSATGQQEEAVGGARRVGSRRGLAIALASLLVVAAVAAWWWIPTGSPPIPDPPSTIAPPTPTGPAQLVLTGLPLGAMITIDGELRSGTSFELEPGAHVITMRADGYQTTVDTVTLGARRRTELAIDPTPLEDRVNERGKS